MFLFTMKRIPSTPQQTVSYTAAPAPLLGDTSELGGPTQNCVSWIANNTGRPENLNDLLASLTQSEGIASKSK